jgi:hypothetical protein
MVIFFPLSPYPFYIFGQLSSDLASKNTELLVKVASVLINLFTPLYYRLQIFETNVKATFMLCKEVVPYLEKRG